MSTGEINWKMLPPTPPTPPASAFTPQELQRAQTLKHYDNSVDALSFCFVATAILISMFLVMAIFERFLRPKSPTTPPTDPETPSLNSKIPLPMSPKTTVVSKEVSVLMPGDSTPSYIANPVPAPCPPEPIIKPHSAFT